MSELKKISGGVLFKTIANFVFMGLGFVISVILNRHYGKETYGLLTLVYTVTGLFSGISDIGSGSAVIKYLPKYLKQKDNKNAIGIIEAGLLLQLLGIFLVAGLILSTVRLIALSFFHRPELIPLLYAGVMYFALFSLMDYLFSVFQGFESWRKEALLNILYPLIYLLLIALVIRLGYGIKIILLANGLSAFLVIVLGIMLMPPQIKKIFDFKYKIQEILQYGKDMIHFGLPLIFINLNFSLVMWMDKAILGRYAPLKDVTLYFIAFNFITVIYLFTKTFFTVFMPFLAKLDIDDKHGTQTKFTIIFRWFLHTGIIASIASFFIIKPIILSCYGQDYYPSVPAFRLMLLALILRSAYNPVGMFVVNVFGKTKRSLVVSTISMIINIFLNILLIPQFGFRGAIIAGIIAYLIYWIISIYAFPQIRELIPYGITLKTFAIFSVVGILTFGLFTIGIRNAYILTILSLFSYLAFLRLFNEINSDDISLLKSVLKNIKKSIIMEAA